MSAQNYNTSKACYILLHMLLGGWQCIKLCHKSPLGIGRANIQRLKCIQLNKLKPNYNSAKFEFLEQNLSYAVMMILLGLSSVKCTCAALCSLVVFHLLFISECRFVRCGISNYLLLSIVFMANNRSFFDMLPGPVILPIITTSIIEN